MDDERSRINPSISEGTADWERLGKILEADPDQEDLTQYIENKEAWLQIRCAALERYAYKKGGEALGLLIKILSDIDEEEELKAIAIQWLRAISSLPRADKIIQTGGAVHTKGLPEREVKEWQSKAAKKPSARIRWLTALDE